MDYLKVGLAPHKNSFFDKKTNTYITLENPVQKIYYDVTTNLSGICHACCSQIPSLILYEGKFPEETMNNWIAKYKLIHKQAEQRANAVQGNSAELPEETPPPTEDPGTEPSDPEDGGNTETPTNPEGDESGEPAPTEGTEANTEVQASSLFEQKTVTEDQVKEDNPEKEATLLDDIQDEKEESNDKEASNVKKTTKKKTKSTSKKKSDEKESK